jgi:ABC-type uncharacterized transport system permease subunit
VVLLGALVDVSYVAVRLLAVLPWFALILAVVAGVVLQLAAGHAASNTEQDEKRDRVRRREFIFRIPEDWHLC